MKQWKELPVEIQERMLECQVEQGNPRDASVFEMNIAASAIGGGFDWNETEEESAVWAIIIAKGEYMEFYNLHPKQPFIPELYEGVPMEVSNDEDFEFSYTLPVFGKANGFYFAWKQQESGIEVTKWFYARPIQTKVPTYTKEELVKIVGHEFNIKEE